MKHPRAVATLALASAALIAGVAVFLAAPAGRQSWPAERETKTFPVASRDGTAPAAPGEPAAGRGSGTPAAGVAPQALPADAVEAHRKATAAMLAHSRENAKRLYGAFFEAQGLPAGVRDEVASILSIPQRALAEEGLAAMRSGTLPTPPTPDTLRAQRARQDQALRSLLGEEGFAAFAEYRTTVPDRIIVDGMKRQGAELSAEQSQLLLAILTDERRKIMGSPGAPRNFDAMPKSQAMAIIEQDQSRLSAAVNRRAETILSPEQTAMLGDVFTRLTKVPRPR